MEADQEYEEIYTIASITQNNQTECQSGLNIFKASFKRFQFRLYLTLFLSQLLPTVYKSVRIYYLGDLPNSWGVNIASQLIWVKLILEVFQEALILPLYRLIGETLAEHTKTKNRIKIGMMITFSIHSCLAVVIGLLASPLTKLMAQNENTTAYTIHYVRLELISLPFESAILFYVVTFTMFNWRLHLYVILFIKLIMSIMLDTFLLNEWKYSLRLGVNGIAYGGIATSVTIFVYCLIITWKKLHMNFNDIFRITSYNLSWLNSWIKIGFFSGLDSLIRNVFYITCVIRMMNVIDKQGVYWRANEFIWNWMLLSYIPLSSVLKQDTGNDKCIDHKIKMVAYICFSLLLSILWLVTIPAWKLFFGYVMNVGASDVKIMYDLVLVLCPFYIIFMLSTLLDSVLYGKGKTGYLAIQSGITNLVVNLPAFVLFLLHVYVPDVQSIAVLFGVGIAIDSLITCFLYHRYLKRVHFKI